MNVLKEKKKALSVFSLIMINVIAVDNLRSIPISSEYGMSIIFYYLLGAIIFMIPTALVAAELATGWPKTGGLYVWIREAFGERWGFFAIWLQWIYNVAWYPTILIFITATLTFLVDPQLANNKMFMLISINILFWFATFINYFGIRASSIASTIGALIGTILPMLAIIFLGALWLFKGNVSQINMHSSQIMPHISNLNQIVFLVVVLFGLIGMEMSAVHADDVKNPKRDYPRALFYSSGIIISTLILSSLAVAIVVPHKDLNLVSGLINAFALFFNAYHMTWMTPIMALLMVIGGLGGVITWIIGPTRGLLVAADDGCLPDFLTKRNKYDMPVNLLILQGVLFTVLSSIFLLLPTVNSSYWLLSDMTSLLALLVYILMFSAVIYLRYKHPEIERTFTIPGGKIGLWCISGIGIITCIGAIFLGFIPPEQIDVGNVFTYELILSGGLILLCVFPFIVFKTLRQN